MEVTDQIHDFGRLKIVGLKRDEAEQAKKSLERVNTFEGVKEEVKTDEQIRDIESVQRSLLAWGKDLGFDLNERLPEMDKYHIYGSEEYQKIREKQKFEDGNGGMQDWANNIHVVDDGDRSLWLRRINHESIHGVSKSVAGFDRDVSRLGLENVVNGSFATLNEAITEMSNIFIKNKYWSTDERLAGEMETKKPSYVKSIVLLDGLLQETAKRRNMEVSEIFIEAEKCLLNGSMNLIKTMSECLGKDNMYALSKLSEEYGDPDEVSRSFGLKKTTEKIGALRRGESVKILEGVIDGGVEVSW